jgi:hypothetical protein
MRPGWNGPRSLMRTTTEQAIRHVGDAGVARDRQGGVGGRHAVHVVGFAAGGRLAVETPAVPAGHTPLREAGGLAEVECRSGRTRCTAGCCEAAGVPPRAPHPGCGRAWRPAGHRGHRPGRSACPTPGWCRARWHPRRVSRWRPACPVSGRQRSEGSDADRPAGADDRRRRAKRPTRGARWSAGARCQQHGGHQQEAAGHGAGVGRFRMVNGRPTCRDVGGCSSGCQIRDPW